MKRISAGLALVTIVAAAVLGPAHSAFAATIIPKAVNGAKVEVTLKTAVERLTLANENRYGYERTKFKLWDDVDRDCQNARAEVLKAESRARTNSGCTVKYGSWFSAYDGLTFKYASDLDIDHMVPLAEAWDSGARSWTAGKREAYANDLTDPRTLIAVSASSNRSKGDKAPNEWLPSRNVCGYVKQWVTVKTRWSLTVDPAEKSFLYSTAYKCPRTVIVTHKAKVINVVYGSTSTGGSGGGGTGGGGTGGGTTDPRFSTCTEAKSHGYGPYYRGVDPEYYWYTDRDSDGIVCE